MALPKLDISLYSGEKVRLKLFVEAAKRSKATQVLVGTGTHGTPSVPCVLLKSGLRRTEVCSSPRKNLQIRPKSFKPCGTMCYCLLKPNLNSWTQLPNVPELAKERIHERFWIAMSKFRTKSSEGCWQETCSRSNRFENLCEARVGKWHQRVENVLK